MPRLSFSNLRSRLLFLVFIVLLPFLPFLLEESYESYHRAREEAVSVPLGLVKKLAAEQERLVDSGQQLLQVLAELPAVQSYDGESCARLFSAIITIYPTFRNLGAAKPNGDVFCSAVPLSGPVNLADRPYFRRALSTRGLTIGGQVAGRIAGERLIPLLFAARNDSGQPRSVVFLGIGLSWIERIVSEAPLPEGSRTAMIDQNGLVLARYPDPEKRTGKSYPAASLAKTVLARRAGTYETVGPDGVELIMASAPIRTPSANGNTFF